MSNITCKDIQDKSMDILLKEMERRLPQYKNKSYFEEVVFNSIRYNNVLDIIQNRVESNILREYEQI